MDTTFSERKDEILQWLTDEYAALQSGTISPALVSRVTVSAYGAGTHLPHCAAVTMEGPRTLLITPYDVTLIGEIERAVREQIPSVSVSVTETGVRIVAQEITTERKDFLIKMVKDRAEEAKQSIRGIREKMLTEIKRQKTEGALSEDTEFTEKKKLQELVDAANEEVKKLCTQKSTTIQG